MSIHIYIYILNIIYIIYIIYILNIIYIYIYIYTDHVCKYLYPHVSIDLHPGRLPQATALRPANSAPPHPPAASRPDRSCSLRKRKAIVMITNLW